MGNVKRGYWPGILLYLSVMVSLGAALIYVERIYIDSVYQLPQSGRTFAVLIFIAFTLFWDGTRLINFKEIDHLSKHDDRIPANKDRE